MHFLVGKRCKFSVSLSFLFWIVRITAHKRKEALQADRAELAQPIKFDSNLVLSRSSFCKPILSLDVHLSIRCFWGKLGSIYANFVWGRNFCFSHNLVLAVFDPNPSDPVSFTGSTSGKARLRIYSEYGAAVRMIGMMRAGSMWQDLKKRKINFYFPIPRTILPQSN